MRAILYILCILSAFSVSHAYAACTSPAGSAGTLEYFVATNDYQLCDGTNWTALPISSTLAACTKAAELQYDTSLTAYKYCDGTNNKEIGCVSSGGGGSCPDAGSDFSNTKNQTLTNPDITATDNFGGSVSISGDNGYCRHAA